MKRIETVAIRRLQLLVKELREEDSTGIGEVIGSTGTGKTQGGLWLAANDGNAARVCGFEGIGRNHLLHQIAYLFTGLRVNSAGKALDTLAAHAASQRQRPQNGV